MFDDTCVFCKIIQGKIPSTIIMQNEHILVIKDIHPKAPIHYLILPKNHITNIASLTDFDRELCWHILSTARDLGSKVCNGAGFNLIFNNGADAGQSVFHLHAHFLSGKNIFDNNL